MRSRKRESYEKSDINGKLIMNLCDLNAVLRMFYEGKSSQKRILIILRENGGMTQRELTERLDVRPGTISEVLGKLENAGLISRIVNPEDKRTIDISLTDKGNGMAQEAAESRESRHREMFRCLSQEEKETLLSLLEKVCSDWCQRYAQAENSQGR